MRDLVDSQSFSAQVHSRLANGDRRGRMLEHARTPAVLRMLGFPTLPLVMSPGVLFKIASGKGGSRAPLSARQIASLPEQIDEAAAVFLQDDGSSVIALSTQCDANENPIVICARPDVRDGLRFVNVLTTAFGKDNAEAWAARQLHALRYIGEKTNPRLPLPGLIYHQTGARETEGSGRKILGPEDLRKFRAVARSVLMPRNVPADG